MNDKTFRAINQKGYTITVNNSKAESHNINIDYPTYFCFALSDAEAIGKMILSHFAYKKNEISSIDVT